jgi:deoxycytidylate deaminase
MAVKSTMSQKHGCVIVHNGKIISTGYNRHIDFFKHEYSIHAEVDAINKVKKIKNILKESDLYIVRINSNNNSLRESYPCNSCAEVIVDHNIRNIYYSVDDLDTNVVYTKLDRYSHRVVCGL